MAQHISRRSFISSLAVLGTTPLWGNVDLLAWQEPRLWSGDDFERALTLLFDPGATLAAGQLTAHPERRDVIIIGGGIAGLTTAYKLNGRRVLLLESAATTGGVA